MLFCIVICLIKVRNQVLAHWYEQHVGVPCIVGKDEGCKSVLEVSSLEEKFSRFANKVVLPSNLI